ncbi:FMN-dependent NADH-azoreductase, partial [Frankia casuarinae]
MPHLLHVDSSLATESSTSRSIATIFAEAWREAHPDGIITYRDLSVTPPPHLDWATVSARFTPPEQLSAEQAEAVKKGEELIAEVEAADEYLLSVPMYNYAVPSTFKAWIDQIIVMGRTVRQAPDDSALTGKKVTVVTAQGGSYGPGTPKEGWDHQQPYVAHILAALGATDIEFIRVEMTLAPVNPALAEFIDLFQRSKA